MPILSIALIVFVGLWVFSQFGRRLSARHAALWFAVITILLLSAAVPSSLSALANFFGFQLVSNFILSSLALVTLLELLLQGVNQTRLSRCLREAFCREAAEQFLARQKDVGGSPEVLVISPCFNEEHELPRTIERLQLLGAAKQGLNFCIVNDGSKDSSQRILNALAHSHSTRHLSNLGVSAALLTGFFIARDLGVNWVVQCDSDGQHPIEDIPKLIETAQAENLDLLIGSRFFGDVGRTQSLASTTWQRWLGGRLICATLRLFGKHAAARDPTSGFRVYSRRAVDVLVNNMPDEYPEPESLAILSAAGLKIMEKQVSMQPRLHGVSSLSGGFKSAKFMFKISASLLGLRLRLFSQHFKLR